MSFLSGPNDYAYLDWFQCKSQSESYGLYGNPSLNNSDMAAYQYSAGGSVGRAGWKEWSAFGVDALTPSLSLGAPWPDIYDTTGSPMPVPLKHYQVRVSPVKGWGGQGIPTQAPAEPNPETPLLLDFNSLDLYTYNRTVPLEWDTVDKVWKFAENYVGSGAVEDFNSQWGTGISGWERGAGKWLIAGAPVKPFGDPMPLGGVQMDQNANYRAAATFNGAEKDIDLKEHWSGFSGCDGSKKIKFLGGYPQTDRDYTYWGKENAEDYGDEAPGEAQGSRGIPLAEAVRPIKGAPLRLQKIPLCIDSKHPLFNCICESASQDHESNTGKDRSISGYFYTLATDPVLYFNDSIGADGETMQWIGEEGVLPLNATCGSETVSGSESGGCPDVFNKFGVTGEGTSHWVAASGCSGALFFSGCSGIDVNLREESNGVPYPVIEICYTGLTGGAATGSGCSDVFNKFGVSGNTVAASGCSNTLLFTGCSGIDVSLNTAGATPVVEICYTGITGSITTSGCENVFRTVYDQSNTPHTAYGCDDSFNIIGAGSVTTAWVGDDLVISHPGGGGGCENAFSGITSDDGELVAIGCDSLGISGISGIHTMVSGGALWIAYTGTTGGGADGSGCGAAWGRITTNTHSIEAQGCDDHLILSGSGGLNITVDDNGQVVFSYTDDAQDCNSYLTYTGSDPDAYPGSNIGFIEGNAKITLSGNAVEGTWGSGDLACISMINKNGETVSIDATLSDITTWDTDNTALWPFGAGTEIYFFSGNNSDQDAGISEWDQFFNAGSTVPDYTGVSASSLEICKGTCSATGCETAFSKVSAGGELLSASGCDTLTVTGHSGINVSIVDDALRIGYTGCAKDTFVALLADKGMGFPTGCTTLHVYGGEGIETIVSGTPSGPDIRISFTGSVGGSGSGCENAFSEITSDDGTLEASGCDSLGISGISGIQTKVEGGALWVGYTGETGGGGGGASPGGSNTYVQYNDNGSFGGSSTFTWTHSTATLNATNVRATDITGLTISGGTIYGDEASFGTSLKISGQDVATGSVCRESWNKIWAEHRLSIPSLDATGCGDEVVIKGSGGIEIVADDTPYDALSNPDGPSILHVKYTGLQGYEKKLITLCEDGVLSSGWVLFKPFE